MNTLSKDDLKSILDVLTYQVSIHNMLRDNAKEKSDYNPQDFDEADMHLFNLIAKVTDIYYYGGR